MTTAELELAESLADLEEWAARPVETYPGRDKCGKSIPYPPQLRVYGPITESNIRSGARLMLMYLCEYARQAEKTWAKLPPDVRRRVAVQALLIRSSRLLAEVELAMARLFSDG